MPPKKDETAALSGEAITGFTAKETKIIAAAFVAGTGLDKYDYDLFANLTGNTTSSIKKMWPPIKRKVIEAQPSFGTFLSGTTSTSASFGDDAGETKAKAAPKAKANNGKKRKATSTEPEDDELVPEEAAEDVGKKKPAAKGRKKKAGSADAEESEKKPAAKRGRKKVKSEEVVDEETKEEEAADGVAQEEI
ncbi:hypothetical protein SLS60_011317 [Paraconiothyrium brasiliense]|uniref:Uncharacterized protein n=1 Tax=Paraconiothyrium brasiliense TaxID=300254 RepID=A0ABR3QJA7_9PLEO